MPERRVKSPYCKPEARPLYLAYSLNSQSYWMTPSLFQNVCDVCNSGTLFNGNGLLRAEFAVAGNFAVELEHFPAADADDSQNDNKNHKPNGKTAADGFIIVILCVLVWTFGVFVQVLRVRIRLYRALWCGAGAA